VLRDGDAAVTQADFDAVWADRAQLARALDGLVADGLIDPLPDGRYALPGVTRLRAASWPRPTRSRRQLIWHQMSAVVE
jgi:hypothetical protein